MVYVQDINGKPMMPTTRHGKVRRLLKDQTGIVASRRSRNGNNEMEIV